MSRDPWRFSESEIRRAVKAVRATGLTIGMVEIGRDGRITVSIGSVSAGPQSGADSPVLAGIVSTTAKD